MQLVTGIPAVLPGTHVTYLTSTNRNAYQEGDDAKEAGYTLGEVKTGDFKASYIYNQCGAQYGTGITVSDDGVITITDGFDTHSWPDIVSSIKGKFVRFYGNESFNDIPEPFRLGVVFIPSDATVRQGASNCYVSKYQEVISYPAIPAGTTIEYLGVLGDKTSIETGSYVGTGTSGISNPNKIKISQVPKFAIISPATLQNSNRYSAFIIWCFGATKANYGSPSGDINVVNVDYSGGYFSWSSSTAEYQLNEAGTSYVYTFFM